MSPNLQRGPVEFTHRLFTNTYTNVPPSIKPCGGVTEVIAMGGLKKAGLAKIPLLVMKYHGFGLLMQISLRQSDFDSSFGMHGRSAFKNLRRSPRPIHANPIEITELKHNYLHQQISE